MKRKIFIDKIIENDLFLKVQFCKISRDFSDEDFKLYDVILNYFIEYLNFYKIDPILVSKIYINFLKEYEKDIIFFKKKMKYPIKKLKFNRIQYDIILMMSVLFYKPRFNIFKELYENFKVKSKNVLFLGSGSGLEIDLIKKKFPLKDLSLGLIDIEFSRFIDEFFPSIRKFNRLNKNLNEYDRIYAIEFIEHIEKPYDYLKKLYNYMRESACLFLTIASNIPQRDHKFNFDNIGCFEEKIQKIGFSINIKKMIYHNLLINGIESTNTIYELSKK